MDFCWAEPYPEVHKICMLFNRTELSNPEKWCYKPLEPYLQEGPQCGIVALAMLAGKTDEQNIQKIFSYAKEQDFTFNGEIFSVVYMATIASKFLENVTVEVYEGILDSSLIKNCLLRSCTLLVPYDTMKDNSPGCYKGHKAHWCVVSGAIQSAEGFFVIARHGKAKNVAIWDIKTLSDSNQQLFEFSPDRKLQDVEYMVPLGGLSGIMGLNKQCVLITPIPIDSHLE